MQSLNELGNKAQERNLELVFLQLAIQRVGLCSLALMLSLVAQD